MPSSFRTGYCIINLMICNCVQDPFEFVNASSENTESSHRQRALSDRNDKYISDTVNKGKGFDYAEGIFTKRHVL